MIVLWIVLGIIGVAVLLLLAALVRTLLQTPRKAEYAPAKDAARTDAYSRKLQEMVRCETISVAGKPDPDKFRAFHKVLAEQFPLVHARLEKTDIDGSLLFRWAGRDPAKKPILLMSHMDVVAADGDWTYPPFSATIADGRIWGRGTGDTKCSLMALMQAAEELLGEGYAPERDVYLASSCTEEVGGDGGPAVVRHLKARGVRLFMASDEGGGVIRDPMTGVSGCFAMVGAFEKGTGNVRFIARGKGGHASAPPKRSPIARLAALVTDVERHNPFRARMSREVAEMLARLAPYASFPMRLLFGNLWLFRPLLVRVMPLVSATAGAMLRTTIAFTTQAGSPGLNVLPQEAYVTANLRFIPHQKKDESLALLRALAQKHDVEMEVLDASDPSPILDTRGAAFRLTERTVNAVFPGVRVSPYVVTGAADARFYEQIADNCVRFSPILYTQEQLRSMHALNEYIDCDVLPAAVDYYKALVKGADGEA